MVMSLYSRWKCLGLSDWKCRPTRNSPRRSRGESDVGSGGIMLIIGFTAIAIRPISRLYSS